jgi:dihydroorotase
MDVLIKNAKIICSTSKHHGKKRDILIIDGKIEKIALNISTKINKIIDVKNSYVSLGWIDIFSHFCDPGFEHKENLVSGRKVATAGGYTDICILPNTNSIIDSKSGVEYLTNKNQQELVQIHPIGAISQHCEGKKLAEMYDMKNSGAIAFSDGKKTINNPALLLKALQYVKPFDGLIIQIPQEESIAKNGLMHESKYSTKFGLSGNPTTSEIISLQRDIELNNYCESKIHFTGISSKEGVEIIKNAKKKNKQITCSATPQHLIFCDEDLENYNSNFKINPPLRSKKDQAALLKAIEDGTIDCIASHHTPQDIDAKKMEFEYAQEGVISLQTCFSQLLAAGISIEKSVELICEAPRKILNLEKQLEENEMACLTIFNTDTEWLFDKKSNQSQSENSALMNKNMNGKIIAVINNNQLFENGK